jgi:hypothetical protein
MKKACFETFCKSFFNFCENALLQLFGEFFEALSFDRFG